MTDTRAEYFQITLPTPVTIQARRDRFLPDDEKNVQFASKCQKLNVRSSDTIPEEDRLRRFAEEQASLIAISSGNVRKLDDFSELPENILFVTGSLLMSDPTDTGSMLRYKVQQDVPILIGSTNDVGLFRVNCIVLRRKHDNEQGFGISQNAPQDLITA